MLHNSKFKMLVICEFPQKTVKNRHVDVKSRREPLLCNSRLYFLKNFVFNGWRREPTKYQHRRHRWLYDQQQKTNLIGGLDTLMLRSLWFPELPTRQ